MSSNADREREAAASEQRINGDGGNGPGLPPPEIESVVPDRGTPGTTVTISGREFRAQAGSIVFGGAAAAIVSWADRRVDVQVPSVLNIGAAGLTDLALTSSIDESATAAFTVLDTTPPQITSLSRTEGLPGDELRLTGERFGTDGTDGRSVEFDGVAVPIVSWNPVDIRVLVPQLAAVGGPGAKTVRVGTLWGTSAAGDRFSLHEPPTVDGIRPPDVPAPPDAELTIEGRGFGQYVESQSRAVLRFADPETGELFETPMEIRRWEPTTIVAVVPGLRFLKTTGAKQLIVAMRLGASTPFPVTIGDVGSITSWTRIEPHARTEDLDAGLAAGVRFELADPLWLLGRQWATGQLSGEDAGTPVVARVEGEHGPLSRWRPGRDGPAAEIPSGIPLETLVERERVFPQPTGLPAPFADLRLAAEAGLHYLRAVAERVGEGRQADTYRKRYLDEYAIEPPTDEERARLDGETMRFLAVVAGRAPDGARLYQDLHVALPPERGGRGQLPEKPRIRERDREAVLAAVADWFTWCETLFSEPPQTQTSWDRERMEYAFAVAATLVDEEIVLEAPEYFEGRLDWPAFVRRSERLEPEGLDEPSSTTFSRAAIPSPVTFPGMPAARLFEFEDARVNLGSVDAGPTDVIRLLFVEFATVFGNDWFAIPLDGLPVGSIVRVKSLVVTDVFGVETSVQPFAEAGGGGAWRMFQPTSVDDDARNLLIIPSTLTGSIESSPVEDVALVRDELANLGWAVERIVMSASGRPLRRHEQYAETLGEAEEVVTPAPGRPPIAYRLMSPVADYWIPLVPREDGTPSGRRMVRSAMRRPRSDGGFDPVLPIGRILEPETENLAIHDEEIPRDGARVLRSWQLARNERGETFLWLGRRKEAGIGEASSGLRFDVVEQTIGPPT